MTDEASGKSYLLENGGSELGRLVGERVYVEGVPRTDPNSGLDFLDVLTYTLADRAGPPDVEKITWTFELTVEGESPEDATFIGRTTAPQGTQGGVSDVSLTDSDGDGVYTGSDFGYDIGTGRPYPTFTTVPSGLQIIQAAGISGPGVPEGCINGGCAAVGPTRVIEDFGQVVLDEDKTFRASVSFPGIDGPGKKSGGSESGDPASVSSGKKSGVPENGDSASGSGGSGSTTASGETGAKADSAKAGGAKTKELPKTGGELPMVGLVGGALLVGGGILARRAAAR